MEIDEKKRGFFLYLVNYNQGFGQAIENPLFVLLGDLKVLCCDICSFVMGNWVLRERLGRTDRRL